MNTHPSSFTKVIVTTLLLSTYWFYSAEASSPENFSLCSVMSLKLKLVKIEDLDVRSACAKVCELFEKTYPTAPQIEYNIAYSGKAENDPKINFTIENVTLWDALSLCADLTGRGINIHETYLEFYLPRLTPANHTSYFVTTEFAAFLVNTKDSEVQEDLVIKAIAEQTGLTVLRLEDHKGWRALELVGSKENHDEMERLFKMYLGGLKERGHR